MATFNLFDEFYGDLLKGEHDFSTDTFKVVLSNTAPNKATTALLSSVTEITGSGYTAGGANVTLTITEPVAGTWQIGGATDIPWTATAADWGAFQYAYVYNSTASTKTNPLIGVLDYGSAVNLANGATFTIDPGANGWAQFTTPTWA